MKKKYDIPEIAFFERPKDAILASLQAGYNMEDGEDGQFIKDFF